MTGKGLAHLEKLTRLRYLYLNTKQITDEVLGGLARADKLHALTGASAAKGERPAKDAEIVSLSLSQTPITDAGLEHLKGLTNLEKLYLYNSRMTGKGLAHLEKLTRLRYLYLNTNQITDEALGGLAKANKLHALTGASGAKGMRPTTAADIISLSLSGTGVTDAGLAHLKSLTRLQRVYLSRTKVTAKGVAELQKAIPGLKVNR
jgi:Leucine-rich repeat (LRR) protein